MTLVKNWGVFGVSWGGFQQNNTLLQRETSFCCLLSLFLFDLVKMC